MAQDDNSVTLRLNGHLGVVVTESGDGVSYRFINLKTKQLSHVFHNQALLALNYKRGTYNAL